MNLFSKNLRYLRKKGNLNQDEISVLFNKRANTIGNWENQKSEPNLAELVELGRYFKVSIQDFLHTDLEKDSLQQEPEAGSTESPLRKIQTYSIQEPVVSTANESNPDAFWLILRELRALTEKVDSLASGMASAAFKKNSDKSYH
jgi:transcriptional regulator with XRE-family HTH domain